MSVVREDGRWYCKPCSRVFPNWEAILKHKQYMRRTGSETHIHCKFCGQDFETRAAENSHIIQNHPQEQKLDCPGCGRGPFPRLASLVSHIEKGDCNRIDAFLLDEVRGEKLKFPTQIERLTKEPVKNNFAGYVSPKHGATGPRHAWREARDPGFGLTAADFPRLSGRTRGATATSSKSDGDEKYQGEEKTAWGSEGNLLSKSTAAQQATKNKVNSATARSTRMVVESMDPHDPDNPAFNAGRYYSDILEQYICPRVRCGKCFKSQVQLVSHLRSPAHGNITYRCPYCQRSFKTLTSITSHVESSTQNCRMRDTDGYEAYLDQLMAGIVEVEEKRNEDGTLQYKTAEKARVTFRGVKKDTTKDHGEVHW